MSGAVRCGGLIGLRSKIELRVDEIQCTVAAVPEELAAAYRRSLKRSVRWSTGDCGVTEMSH